MNNRSSAVSLPRQLSASEADLTAGAMSVQQVLGQISLIQQIMEKAMIANHHYGLIPGCGDKPALLKPGAEKLCLTFRLAPSYDTVVDNLDQRHREYRVTCTLTSILSGVVIGAGMGSCSSMESKYRYRGNEVEATDRPVPRAYWDVRQEDPKKAQELLGGAEFSAKKIDGTWMIVKKKAEKMENPDLADQYNTVLKMAKKRALVDAVLTATAASDIFAQDIEDLAQNMEASRSQESQRQERPNATEVEVEEVSEPRVERWDGFVQDVSEKSGTTGKGKAWTLYTLTFLLANDAQPTASTFDKKLADAAARHSEDNQRVVAGVKPKAKGGFEVLTLETVAEVAAN